MPRDTQRSEPVLIEPSVVGNVEVAIKEALETFAGEKTTIVLMDSLEEVSTDHRIFVQRHTPKTLEHRVGLALNALVTEDTLCKPHFAYRYIKVRPWTD